VLVGFARIDQQVIGEDVRSFDHVSARMEIPRAQGRLRRQREEVRALASCISVLADQLTGTEDQAAP
jgi:hypothetical protein